MFFVPSSFFPFANFNHSCALFRTVAARCPFQDLMFLKSLIPPAILTSLLPTYKFTFLAQTKLKSLTRIQTHFCSHQEYTTPLSALRSALFLEAYSHSDCVSTPAPKTNSSNAFHLYITYKWRNAKVTTIVCRRPYPEMESISPPLESGLAF